MFQHLGGKQIILRFVMKTPKTIKDSFINLMVKRIRYEIVAFAKSVEVKKPMNYVEKGVSKSIAKIMKALMIVLI